MIVTFFYSPIKYWKEIHLIDKKFEICKERRRKREHNVYCNSDITYQGVSLYKLESCKVKLLNSPYYLSEKL